MGKILVAWLMLTATAVAAPLSSPREVVQSAVARVLAVIRDTAAAEEPERTERRRVEFLKVGRDLFDFDEMARRTLSRHWAARSARERREFVVLFRDLLERSYVDRIEVYARQTITYPGEVVDDGYAVVKSRVSLRPNAELALDYRLHLRDGRWRVYDVMVEGVSFVSNYRNEFDRIIQSSSYASLVDRLRRKRIAASMTDRS
ncbi:MAG TPA: ABC transporter substrate-binding protein [Methylomirabilota bacterium]|jgi:phospholipid transport system substrate-binding protein